MGGNSFQVYRDKNISLRFDRKNKTYTMSMGRDTVSIPEASFLEVGNSKTMTQAKKSLEDIFPMDLDSLNKELSPEYLVAIMWRAHAERQEIERESAASYERRAERLLRD